MSKLYHTTPTSRGWYVAEKSVRPAQGVPRISTSSSPWASVQTRSVQNTTSASQTSTAKRTVSPSRRAPKGERYSRSEVM